MLSRVADSLYWLGRYVERAENLARMVEVTRQDALETFNRETKDNIWKPVIYATSIDFELSEGQKSALEQDPAHYIALSPLHRGLHRGRPGKRARRAGSIVAGNVARAQRHPPLSGLPGRAG